MLAYLRIANHYNIIDKPNSRSSHTHITIRGGGIIFMVAVIGWWILNGFQYPWFLAGFVLISAISFVDDLGHVPNKLRITAHLAAVILLLLQIIPMVGAFTNHYVDPEATSPVVGVSTDHYWLSVQPDGYIWLFSIPIIMGFLNAYNFMDGINGITVLNALVTLGTFFYLNQDLKFIDQDLIIYSSMALLVFAFFNFRKKAICFAGDVGAVSTAFLIAFLLISLISQTRNIYYTTLVLVYGVDSVGTIIERLIKRENIFEAHRSHLYQLMANLSKIPHLTVSGIYGIVQLLVNALVILSFENTSLGPWIFGGIFLLLVTIFAFAKIKLYRVFANE